MGALADTLKDRLGPGVCKFARLIDKHADDDDRAWIDNPNTPHRVIAAAASAAWGEFVADHTVRKHRIKGCTCYRSGDHG